MTSDEWDTSTDPQEMLNWLTAEGRLPDRKARLFAVACCRRIWHLLTDERSRKAVEVAERLADGLELEEDLDLVTINAADASLAAEAAGGARAGANAAYYALDVDVTFGAKVAAIAATVAASAYTTASKAPACTWDDITEAEQAEQGFILRDFFGFLPFRSVSLDPSWLTPQVVALAQTIYEQRAFARMDELGAALAAAGCDNGAMLAHCRQQEGHQRGCWLVDLLLKK